MIIIFPEIELFKVEKRYRLNPDPPEPPLRAEPVIESALPIPREHPDVLLHSTDFVPKVGFLKNIGLDIMPPSKRDGNLKFLSKINFLNVVFNFQTNFFLFASFFIQKSI